MIGADDTAAPVDLDQLFNTLDPKTRARPADVIQGQATYYGGRSKEYEQSLKYLSPAFSHDLAADQGADAGQRASSSAS